VEASNQSIDVQVPANARIIHRTDGHAVVRVLVHDNRTKRTSGFSVGRILELPITE